MTERVKLLAHYGFGSDTADYSMMIWEADDQGRLLRQPWFAQFRRVDSLVYYRGNYRGRDEMREDVRRRQVRSALWSDRVRREK